MIKRLKEIWRDTVKKHFKNPIRLMDIFDLI